MFFNKNCVFPIEKAYRGQGPYNIYKGKNFVIKYVLFIGLRHWTDEIRDKEFLTGTEFGTEFEPTLEPNYLLSVGIHNGYNHDYQNRFIGVMNGHAKKFGTTVRGTVITPPSLSFAHGLKYKENQNEEKLIAMNKDVRKWIEENSPETRFIDFARMSKNLVSCDGIHYGFNLNKVLLSIYFAGL